MHVLKILLMSFIFSLSFVLVKPIFAEVMQKLLDVPSSVNKTINKSIVLATVNVIDAKKIYEESRNLLEKSNFNEEKTK